MTKSLFFWYNYCGDIVKLIDYYNNVEREVSLEEIGKAGAGYNAPTIVIVDGIKGYKKKSINCETFDSFEYLISILGKLLDIKVADTYFFDDGSIFSKSIIADDEEFITSSDLQKYITITEEEIAERNRFNETLETLSINQNSVKYIAQSSEEIDYVVNLFIRMIKKLGLNNEEEIIRDYIRMCFLDTLTGNKDRVSGNFGLIKKGDSYSFAPLFDSSTIAYPDIPNNFVQLNNYCIDRDNLQEYIINKYPHYISDILDIDMNKIKEEMTKLANQILTEKDKEWFDDMVISKLPSNLNQLALCFESSNEQDIKEKEVSY